MTVPAPSSLDLDGVIRTLGLRTAMRDGTQLAADLYHPSDPATGPWPVLLMRQPYGRDIASTVVYAHPTWFARQGYLVVVQDVRGRGDSEGKFYAFRQEAEDGYDTVLWAADLPGSNGRVGMYGFSYQGSTQLLAALGKPAPLRALAPHMTAFDLYHGWFYRGGLLQLQTTLGWANQMLREDARRTGATTSELYAALERSSLNPAALCHAYPLAGTKPLTDPAASAYARDWLEHDEPDVYWPEFDLEKRAAEFELPMFHLAGWYDFYLRGTMSGYRATVAAAKAEQFIVCGPWGHIPWGRNVGGTDFGPDARLDTDALLVAWFDHWLKDKTRDARTRGATYFMLGENRWHSTIAWPPPKVHTETVFLQSSGRANSLFGEGVLTSGAASGPCDQFHYDPEVPVLAPGGQTSGALMWGPADLAPQQQGNNLLVYTTAVLDAPLRLAGAPSLRLFVRSTAPDTAFVARLSRVTRIGAAVFLTLGAVRLRDGTPEVPRSSPWEADIIVELFIQLDDIAVRLDAGESLRLDVSSSAFPLLARHPNTMHSPNRINSPSEFSRALQTVYHDAARPSALTLPVLPLA